MPKHHYLLAAICVAMSLISCKKENLSNTKLNSTTGASTDAEASQKAVIPIIKYGAVIGSPLDSNNKNFQINVANQLGVYCLRERVTIPAKKLTGKLVPVLNSKYKVVLNFTSPGSGERRKPFRKDLSQYQQDLNDVLNTFTVMPEVAVIENEEANQLFYSGYAQDYINLLAVAIDVMHARNITVADGGLPGTGLCYLVYKDFLAQGKNDSAQLFKQLTQINPTNSTTVARGMFTDTLLMNFAIMPLDFVNFHWKAKSPDTLSLNQVINYLKIRTNKPVISNELGQQDNDPTTLLQHVQMCTNQGLSYILWYSPEENSGLPATPLQHSDGTLTATGIAYKNYLATNN